MNSYVSFLGRVLIGLPFAMSGLSTLVAWSDYVEDRCRGTSVPATRVRGGGGPQLGGGLLLVLCYRMRC
jgi:putative oxidoreductase